jgi:hypothetical protein
MILADAVAPYYMPGGQFSVFPALGVEPSELVKAS